MRVNGIILVLCYYLSILIFCASYIAKSMIWLKSAAMNAVSPYNRETLGVFVKSIFDIIFLRRLIIVNDVLWVGEWFFHVSFALVILRHLRYFLNPVPDWIWSIQPIGLIAGYVLPIALVYIFFMKLFLEKKQYVSSYNFILLLLIFVMSLTGLLMKNVYQPDIVAIKEFIIGAVTFRFLSAPESPLFIFHFVMVLILIIKLPTHVFAAPLTIIDARQRNETVKELVHGK